MSTLSTENPVVNNLSARPSGTADSAICGRILRDKANFVLTSTPALPRELRIELSAQDYLYAAVYVDRDYLSQATAPLSKCHAVRDAATTATYHSLRIGTASFRLTAEEWAELCRVLKPLGLAIEQRS